MLKIIRSSSIVKLLNLTLILYPVAPLHVIPSLLILKEVLRSKVLIQALLTALIMVIPFIKGSTLIYVCGVTITLILTIISLPRINLTNISLATLLSLVSMYVILHNNIYDIYTFTSSLRGWVISGTSSFIPIYLTILINTVLIISTSFFYNFGKRELSEGFIPVTLFILLLISAAILLALGSESKANKLAELAYYNLVIGVVIELYNVVRRK